MLIRIILKNILKKLNTIPKDLDKRIDNKIVELQTISQSIEKKNKKLNREYIRNILIKEYKTNVTNKRNKIWNYVLIKSLHINSITTLRNIDYIKFYDNKKIVLIPSYLDDDKNPYYFCSYRGMNKTNHNLISLLKKKIQKKMDKKKYKDKL